MPNMEEIKNEWANEAIFAVLLFSPNSFPFLSDFKKMLVMIHAMVDDRLIDCLIYRYIDI